MRTHEAVIKLAGAHQARLVGCEYSPHRMHIQVSPEAHARLRYGFLTHQLDSLSGSRFIAMSLVDGQARAPAPRQTPLALLEPGPAGKKVREVVCHLEFIDGYVGEGEAARSLLGSGVVTDLNAAQAYITRTKDGIYVHSNFKKRGCKWPTKVLTNRPVDLLTIFANLVRLEEEIPVDLIKAAHYKYARYTVDAGTVGRRGDEFYAGASNVRFV